MTEKFNFIRKYQTAIFFVALAVLLYFALNELATRRIESLSETLRAQIENQEALLMTTAELTARNGADEVTESIVRDCPTKERTQFDRLLGQLNTGLNASELREVERLFWLCGGFTAERKLMMVARLSREIEVYENYVAQLKAITSESAVEVYPVNDWKQLAADEKKQGQLFNELVNLQGKIISTLLEGRNINSDEIVAILTEVKEKQEALLVANKQAGELRSKIVSE
jgi:hypothetical protein